ncbi:MAG: DUF3180 domain-containing protein [Aeromicrobium sp.]|uniref:DUF3180 domain-containing protein n=1 Tax=Aeromicrobium sp. TaxID=1871063 RepID=UPI003C47FB19
MNPMRRTSVLWVLGVFAPGLVVGLLTPPVIIRLDGTVPRVSWAAGLLLFVAAAGVGLLAYNTWQSLHKKKTRMTSQYGVTVLSIAKSGAAVGALIAGFYTGFAVTYLDDLDTVLGRERAIHSGVAAVASVLLLIASLLLERACIVPHDEDDDAIGEPA